MRAHRIASVVILVLTQLTHRSLAGKDEPPLTFNRKSANNDKATSRHVFKILQIADLHWGEDPDTKDGRKQDRKSAEAIKTYLEVEQPDLVVLSGDQISSDFYIDNAREIHSEVIQAMKDVMPSVKWCTIMGNHDDHPYEVVKDGKIVKEIEAETTRKDMLKYDASLSGSYTQRRGKLSNYVVPLYLDDEAPAVDVYVFDTGGGSMEKELSEDQIEWYRDTSLLSRQDDVSRPAVAFQHIPTRQGFEFKDGCVGEDSKEVFIIKNKPRELEAMVDEGNMHFVGVGHNHGNSYCCPHQDKLHFCFGRHSGYGGYDGADKGARVYQLEILIDEERNRQFSWKSWVREADGDKRDRYEPPKSYEYRSPPLPTSAPTTLRPSGRPSQEPTMKPTSEPTASSVTNGEQTSVSPTSAATTTIATSSFIGLGLLVCSLVSEGLT